MGRFVPFVFGGMVGAAIALLSTNKTGDETRAFVADKVNEIWGNAQSISTDASTRGQQFVNDAVAKGQAAYQSAANTAQQVYTQASTRAQDAFNAAQGRVQDAADNATPFATTANDELREKIEAARQRIAAQVAKNANAATEAPAQVEVEAEAVIETVETVDDAAQDAQ